MSVAIALRRIESDIKDLFPDIEMHRGINSSGIEPIIGIWVNNPYDAKNNGRKFAEMDELGVKVDPYVDRLIEIGMFTVDAMTDEKRIFICPLYIDDFLDY